MALTLPPNIGGSHLHGSSSPSPSSVFLPSSSHINMNKKKKKKNGSRCSSSSSRASINYDDNSSRRRKSNAAAAAHTTKTAAASPLQAAEELAARFGFEVAIAGLELLFRQAAQPPPDVADPTHPGRRPVRVAYQGARGSYCQEAVAAAFPASSCYELSLVPCAHMEDAFAALEDRSADRAVIPIENSIDGPIPRNLDLLLRHPEVRIAGEYLLPVDHCLLALPTSDSGVLRRVVSHPQALAHCRDRLVGMGLEVEEAETAAGAAQFVAENRVEDTGVIGSKAAAREFGLRILERNFQDQPQVNRFLKLALASVSAVDAAVGRGTPRTTVAFSLGKGPSDLFRLLWVFESRGVKVTRLDHRPNRSRPLRIAELDGGDFQKAHQAFFDYVYVVEVEGLESDHAVRSALECLHEFADFARVLGSYKSTWATT